MVAVAALTVPELSVGAGELADERTVQSRVPRAKLALPAPVAPPAARRASLPQVREELAPLARPAPKVAPALPSAVSSPLAVPPVPAEPPVVAAAERDAVPLAVPAPLASTFAPGTGAGLAPLVAPLPHAASDAAPAVPEAPVMAPSPAEARAGFAAAVPGPAVEAGLMPALPEETVAPDTAAPRLAASPTLVPMAAAAGLETAMPLHAPRQVAAPRAPAAAPSLPRAERAKAAPAASRPAATLPPRSATPALAGIPRSALRTTPPGAAAPSQLEVNAQLIARVDGRSAGRLDFRQTGEGLSVRLGSLATIVGDRLDPAVLARIQGSSSANIYLSLAQLQAQGIPISYDPVYDEFNIGTGDTRPKAARKVHMDQISAPERGANAAAMSQVRR